MMALACQGVSKAFGTDEIIQNASFHIEENEKAAIVGINGAGKTTLLRIIMGELEADQGQVVLAKNKTIGYLPQNPDISGNRSIYEEVLLARQEVIDLQDQLVSMEAAMSHCQGEELERLMERYNQQSHAFAQQGGDTYKSEVVGVIKGLGFAEEEFTKRMQELSGGQTLSHLIAQRRISAAKRLLAQSGLPISAVAEAVGISDYNYFSRVFRSLTGTTPRTFRENGRQKAQNFG